MDDSTKINVRLSRDEFRQLDTARAARGEKWQTLMHRLLVQWMAEGGDPAEPGTEVARNEVVGMAIPANLRPQEIAILEEAAREFSRILEEMSLAVSREEAHVVERLMTHSKKMRIEVNEKKRKAR